MNIKALTNRNISDNIVWLLFSIYNLLNSRGIFVNILTRFSLILGCLACSMHLSGMDHQICFPTPVRANAPKPGKVILILGTSSAGKTRASKEISDFVSSLSQNSIILAMDEEDDCGISRTVRAQFPSNWSCEHIIMYRSILEQTSRNKIVIFDLMLFETSDDDITESFISKLKTETEVFSVLVYCPIGQLLRNVASRNTSPSDFERRSPVSVVGQYLDMYCAKTELPIDDLTPPASIIEEIESSELILGIQALSELEIEPSEAQSRQAHIEKMQRLAQRQSSPITVPANTYNFVVKNTGNLATDLGPLFYKLFHWIKPYSS